MTFPKSLGSRNLFRDFLFLMSASICAFFVPFFISATEVHAQTPDSFSTTWSVNSGDTTIKIPTVNSGYNFNIYWEEVGVPANNGSSTGNSGDVTITVPAAGTYRVDITGAFPQINFLELSANDAQKLLTIEQWGDIQWRSMRYAFYQASNLTSISGTPNLSNLTSLEGMFFDASSFNGDLSSWNVSSVTNMRNMFVNAYAFNGDMSNWDVSSVTNMEGMFSFAPSFNDDLSAWNVSSVTTMREMFYRASAFNGDISNWDVSSVTNMENMFGGTPFNGDLSAWDVSSVTNMRGMFAGTSFNGDLSNWDVSSVTNMIVMFSGASSFNGDISTWDVSSVTDMGEMFYRASSFNSDLSNWNVSSVTNMNDMFHRATSFNRDLSAWDVSSVTNMRGMFLEAFAFNGDISTWDVSSVTSMVSMFNTASAFNGDISNWNVSSVTDMDSMFNSASAFNGDISNWDVSSVTSMGAMFLFTNSWSNENYTKALIAWSSLPALQSNVPFYTNAKYFSTAIAARSVLTNSYGWNITDKGVYLNTAPVLASIGNKNVGEGGLLEFTITATDANGENLIYSAANLPVGSSFDANTQTFSWTPSFEQVGNYVDVEFTVTDDGIPSESDTELITITVENTNRAPVLNSIGDQTVTKTTTLQFVVSATDPDGGPLTYSAINLPTGAKFNSNTRTFTWKPKNNQVGIYPGVEFIVTDDGVPIESDSETITITVTN